MPTWNFTDYVDEDGESPFARWFVQQPLDARAHMEDRLLTMEGLENWQPKWATKLTDWDGLVELRIPFKKVQYRPLGMYQPGRTFVLLCGAIEKGDEIPKRHLDAADRRRKQVLKDPSRVRPHQF